MPGTSWFFGKWMKSRTVVQPNWVIEFCATFSQRTSISDSIHMFLLYSACVCWCVCRTCQNNTRKPWACSGSSRLWYWMRSSSSGRGGSSWLAMGVLMRVDWMSSSPGTDSKYFLIHQTCFFYLPQAITWWFCGYVYFQWRQTHNLLSNG